MLRLSVAYALLDASPIVHTHHLEAARAVWAHCEETVGRVFAGDQPDLSSSDLSPLWRKPGTPGWMAASSETCSTATSQAIASQLPAQTWNAAASPPPPSSRQADGPG